MLQNIPTHVIAGPLGAGKTTLIKQLIQQRPTHERWAVLVNEFGQVGLDAALLSTADDGIAIGEVAGGCLCCVNGAPFQIGLARLLRKARPERIFIEPSGLGHPLALLHQLHQAPWLGVLAVQPLVMVLNGEALRLGQWPVDNQHEALSQAGSVVVSRATDLSEQERLGITSRLAPVRAQWLGAEGLNLEDLPTAAPLNTGADVHNLPLADGMGDLSTVWTDPQLPICQVHAQPQAWSIGWRWHPNQMFDLKALAAWLEQTPWCRAKAVIHSPDGWYSVNAVAGTPAAGVPVAGIPADSVSLHWQPTEWRRDTRLELIFTSVQSQAALQEGFAACRAEAG
ncbi:CobW family GTP-binding protein [Pseudomonas sp. nanlin1]|uniref:CobW family GTP-binding protein n=1 Tax=Pseudomonas sp. nanlin1 TaxID=3040605 RepID=UPI00388F16E0